MPKNSTRVARNCQHCGISFIVYPSRKTAKYCSNSCYHTSQPVDPRERFWKHVSIGNPDECWDWTGSVAAGYGTFNEGCGKLIGAHRYSWKFANGPIPKNKEICHSCDRKICVNPAHLFPGSRLENVADAVAKGRHAKGKTHGLHLHPEKAKRGQEHGNAKLTSYIVLEMRKEYATGQYSFRSLGMKYGVGAMTAHRAVHKVTWAHVS